MFIRAFVSYLNSRCEAVGTVKRSTADCCSVRPVWDHHARQLYNSDRLAYSLINANAVVHGQ